MTATLNVIRAELFKVRQKRRTYVLAGLYWLLLPVLALVVAKVLEVNVSGSFLENEGLSIGAILHEFASPFGLARLALAGPAYLNPSYYMIIIALFAALLIGEERSQNMWKTTLVAQPNRTAVFVGKFLVAWLMFAVLVVGAMLSGVLLGAVGTLFLPTDFSGAWGSLFPAAALQILFAVAAIAFAFLMIFMLRNVALGIVTVFFLPGLIEALYSAFRALVVMQPLTRFNAVFQALNLQQTLENVPKYYFTANLYAPTRSLVGDILPMIDGVEMDSSMLGGLLGSNLTMLHSGIVMAVYFAVFALIGYWLFLRRDVA